LKGSLKAQTTAAKLTSSKPKRVAWRAGKVFAYLSNGAIVDKQNSALLLDLSNPDQEKFSICIMEAFFQENRDSYIKQVATFQPSQDQAKRAGGESGEEDTLIGARVRPLLPNEIEDSEVVGISVRPEAGYADIHELRRKINGQPTLNVKGFFLVLKSRVLMFLRSLPASGSTRSMDLIRHQRMSTMALLHRWYRGRGGVESVLCLPMARPDLGKRTV